MHQPINDIATRKSAIVRSSGTSLQDSGFQDPGYNSCGVSLEEAASIIRHCNVFLLSRGLPINATADGFNYGNRFHTAI